ncbi:polyphosphate kinase 2 family protein [Helcococcus kunzii]|uniref:polyphosphate kinase 2 family protein n=1 Tax=Helcococcus kunzii TaxID=40091 RepID=UPI00389D0228
MAATMVLSIIIEEIKSQMKAIKENKKKDEEFKFNSKNDKKIIESIDTKQKISEKEYDNIKSDLQDKVGELAYELYKREIPTIILFEGIDAAGKGGTIERLVNEIDPRVYNINPISAPSDAELDHHYLWRFFNNMPKKGHIAIFDRSWYGRVLVERVEKFANEKTWSRAYDEINTMEEMLIDQGVFLLKYHLVISRDEQERRFKDREDEKPYKITDEDWRNRDKWDEYIIAMDDMIHYTSTKKSPWKVISSEDKKFARIAVLKDFVERAEKFLKDE